MNDKELSPRCGAHATSEAPADAESFPAPDAAQRLKRLLAETAARIADRSREAAAQSPDVQKTQDAEPAGEAPSLRLDLGRPLVTEEEALLLAEAPAEHTLAILELGGLARALLLPNPSYRCCIINEKSGRCPENCAFCAQSKVLHTNAPEFPMVEAGKLEAAALRLEREGVRRFGIVTSGRGPSNKDIEALASALEGMRGKTRIGFCASLGILNDERAQALAAAGFASAGRFFAMVRAHDIECAELELGDHYDFSKNPFADRTEDMILITGKDAVKCVKIPAIKSDPRIWMVGLEVELDPYLIDLVDQKAGEAAKRLGRHPEGRNDTI